MVARSRRKLRRGADHTARLRRLSTSSDPLERLRALVDFEAFRAEFAVALPGADRSYGGRPLYDPVPMFCILVRQAPYTLSDEETGQDTSRPIR